MSDDDAPSLVEIGIIGMTNLGLLLLVIIWRIVLFVHATLITREKRPSSNFYKRLILHLALLFAIVCELPMYSGFIIINGYIDKAYAFHKFSCAFIFAAYSITISDWASVLHDIREVSTFPLLFRKATLIALNMIIFLISTANFIYIISLDNLSTYLSSGLYVTAIFIQVFASLVLTVYMLQAGLKLAHRIGGAMSVFNKGAGSSGPRHEFLGALMTLNLVTGCCTLSIFIQMIILSLNYLLGLSTSTRGYVGPAFFYWTFYAWVPLWVPVISLLYLQRVRKPNSTAAARGSNSNIGTSLLGRGRGDGSTEFDEEFLCLVTDDSSYISGYTCSDERTLSFGERVSAGELRISKDLISLGGLGHNIDDADNISLS